MVQDPNQDLLDQPVAVPAKSESSEWAPWRYAVTLLLFPSALVRLRVDTIDWDLLLLRGLFSSFQFLSAGALFAAVRLLYLAHKGKEVNFFHLSLRTAVELILFVGLGQLLWQFFA